MESEPQVALGKGRDAIWWSHAGHDATGTMFSFPSQKLSSPSNSPQQHSSQRAVMGGVRSSRSRHGQPLRAAGEREKIHHGLLVPLEDVIIFFCYLLRLEVQS